MVAHAGHVLIDLAIFVVPVGAIAVALLVANLRGSPSDRDDAEGSG